MMAGVKGVCLKEELDYKTSNIQHRPLNIELHF
jgi:hypothetical protein